MKSRLRQGMKTGILASWCVLAGLGAIAVQAQVNPSQLQAFVEALRLAAPPQQANDGMYSDWQVLPGIIPSWTKQCMGKAMSPTAFETERAAAKKTITCIAMAGTQPTAQSDEKPSISGSSNRLLVDDRQG